MPYSASPTQTEKPYFAPRAANGFENEGNENADVLQLERARHPRSCRVAPAGGKYTTRPHEFTFARRLRGERGSEEIRCERVPSS